MAIKDRFHIKEIDKKTAQAVVIKNHYLHRQAPCSKAFGLFDNQNPDSPVGVVMYGVSPSSTLLKGICGEDEARNVYELTRLWVDDSVPKNGESFLIGNTVGLLDREIIVSFADSSQGHVGAVYQATNWLYTGLSAKFKDPKVKGMENMHHATYANGLTNKQVVEKFGEDNVYFVERPRKYRYVIFNANRSRKKELMAALRYQVLPYPKACDMVA